MHRVSQLTKNLFNTLKALIFLEIYNNYNSLNLLISIDQSESYTFNFDCKNERNTILEVLEISNKKLFNSLKDGLGYQRVEHFCYLSEYVIHSAFSIYLKKMIHS